MTVATDSAGVLHIAASASVNGSYVLAYAECAGSCEVGASWKVKTIQAQPTASLVPTIALTQDGRPRILYASDSPAGYIYTECNADCTGAGAWNAVRLTTDQPTPSPAPRPRIPFAVSPAGAAAFANVVNTNDPLNKALAVQYCMADCGNGTSWGVPIPVGPGNYATPRALAFAADESLAVLASEALGPKYGVSYFGCAGNCSAQTSWSEVDNLWVARDDLDFLPAEMTRTASGKVRVVVRAHDPNDTTSSEVTVASVLGYLGCDSACAMPASWSAPVVIPGPGGGESEIGFGLALDSAGQPTIAFTGSLQSGYITCTGSCTGTTGVWSTYPDVSSTYLTGNFPVTVPAQCNGVGWGPWLGPALALDAQGRPILSITAQAKGFGGQCGTGSLAITTDSFLSLP
jgi:hypothetical protein